MCSSDLGINSLTGGRIKRIQQYVNEPFLLTYGDGVSDVNISELINHHNKHKRTVTVTAVQPSGRFGGLEIENDILVKSFVEKKININKDLYKLYQDKKFRQYKWYAFINKKRTEDNMLNKIEKEIGRAHV